ncbi:U3 snoRNP protein [Phlyctochytrium bullatum]|nr:U3 snoRNP protein [Phlyctochytrium bullatum]
MAEQVQYHLERMLPELEDLEVKGIFSKAEIQAIVKKRTALEYSIHRRVSRKSDFLRYIEYEKTLEALRKKRTTRLGIDKQQDKKRQKRISDHSIIKRIHGLYQNLLRKFPGDLDLWIDFIKWCKSSGSSKALGRVFARAIQLHLAKPVIWILSAKWEFEDNNDMTSARILFQRALRINPESQQLWLEYFKLELLFAAKLIERRNVLFPEKAEAASRAEGVITSLEELADEDKTLSGMLGQAKEETPTDAESKATDVLAIPLIVYRNAVKAISGDLSFRIQFFNLLLKFGTSGRKIRDEIVSSVMDDFHGNWDALAFVAESKSSLFQVDDPRFPAALKETISLYDTFTQEFQSEKIWSLYAGFLHRLLQQNPEQYLQKYIRIKLLETRNRAKELGLIEEAMYLEWINDTPDENERRGLVKTALQTFDSSPDLWCALVEVSPGSAQEIFQEAFRVIEKSKNTDGKGEKHATLWSRYMDWYSQDADVRIQDVCESFRKALRRNLWSIPSQDSLSEKFLRWIYEAGGLDQMRDQFQWLYQHQKVGMRAINVCLEVEIQEITFRNQSNKGMMQLNALAANEGTEYCRKLFEILLSSQHSKPDVLEEKKRSGEQVPHLDNLQTTLESVQFFIVNCTSENGVVNLFMDGQYQGKSERHIRDLDIAFEKVKLGAKWSHSRIPEIERRVKETLSRIAQSDEDEGMRQIGENPVFTRVRDTYNRTLSTAQPSSHHKYLDDAIRSLFTKRNVGLAIGVLQYFFTASKEGIDPHTDEGRKKKQEAKKAAIYLGHCYRILSQETTNNSGDGDNLHMSGYWYETAFDLESESAALYMAQFKKRMQEHDAALMYLDWYIERQEPNKTIKRATQ